MVDWSAVIFVLALICGVILWGLSINENDRIEQAKVDAHNREVEAFNREVDRLSKTRLVSIVSDRLAAECISEIKASVNSHINRYKHRPQTLSDIWMGRGFRVSTSEVAGINFQTLGYHDLTGLQKKAFPYAMQKYSKKWKAGSDTISTNESYWNNCAQQILDDICREKKIDFLKYI